MTATISFPALGTTAQLTLADERHAAEAEALMRRRLQDIDQAASRFRRDSELMLVETVGGPHRVSALLSGTVHTALAAARETGGLVDPTVSPGRPGDWSAVGLDPQLLCYSWISGISEVAQIVFVRKRLVEIQYLHTRITDEQRHEFSDLVQETIRQIESAQFLPHSGIRFPQNPCSTCPYLGLCLGKPALIEAALIRRPGAQDFGVFDELTY